MIIASYRSPHSKYMQAAATPVTLEDLTLAIERSKRRRNPKFCVIHGLPIIEARIKLGLGRYRTWHYLNGFVEEPNAKTEAR